MGDARKRAEEALARFDAEVWSPTAREATLAARLRALLAETATADEVYRERDLLRDRLDQFEAYGFPNVATVLDRLEALRASRSIDLDETAPAPAPAPAPDEVREAAITAFRELLSEPLDLVSPASLVATGMWQKEDASAPFWTEAGLYGRVGKEAARTLLARHRRAAAALAAIAASEKGGE